MVVRRSWNVLAPENGRSSLFSILAFPLLLCLWSQLQTDYVAIQGRSYSAVKSRITKTLGDTLFHLCSPMHASCNSSSFKAQLPKSTDPYSKGSLQPRSSKPKCAAWSSGRYAANPFRAVFEPWPLHFLF
ncbi:hypothetical protein VNO77_43812 [Canavalia gladiata]|uniref:Uncharacterized protein n=1 Tax=Canavalia gladiata TaxID=3824 RepID=A0AAN9PN87_CANGL